MASAIITRFVFLTIALLVAALPDNIFRITPEIFADIETYKNASLAPAPFHVYDDEFLELLGDSPELSVILESSNSSFTQFHEGPVITSYDPPTLFLQSNRYNYSGINSPITDNKTVSTSRVTFDVTSEKWTAEIITTPVIMGNGATLDQGDGSSIIMCQQGDLVHPPAIVQLSTTVPFAAKSLINSYMGIPFNSPNDVVQSQDGAIWFTDPGIGFLQHFRPKPQLPPQVYRWLPGTTDIRVVTDGLSVPNGIAFSADEKTVYITDTGLALNPDLTAARTIYAYDVVDGQSLTNRRTFAMVQNGIPDGIKTDGQENVYSGVGDGIDVWNKHGKYLGKIKVDGGVANFVLGENGMVFVLNEKKLWLAKLGGMMLRNSN